MQFANRKHRLKLRTVWYSEVKSLKIFNAGVSFSDLTATNNRNQYPVLRLGLVKS